LVGRGNACNRDDVAGNGDPAMDDCPSQTTSAARNAPEGNAFFSLNPTSLSERKKAPARTAIPEGRSDVQIVPVARQLASQEIVKLLSISY